MPETAATVAWPPIGWPRARRRSWLALVATVIGVHLVAVDELAADRLGWGKGEPPPRIEVAFVRELAQSSPPLSRPLPLARRRVAAAPAAPASSARPPEAIGAPEATEPAAMASAASETAPEPPPRVADELPPAPADAASAAVAGAAPSVAEPAAAAPAAEALTPAAQAFEWPPSTRLRFRLEGWYRGRFEGSATVDWLRDGLHYQVHLQTSVGPLLSRRLTSDGELTDQGLAPRRFDGEQRVLFRDPKRWTQKFARDRITLADGTEVDALPGAQDEASQFVQLTWLFTNQPALLKVGSAVTVPLALNRRVDRWVYDVVDEELLYLPFGSVPTFHLKPRREAGGGDLTPQIWIAPTLQYLPVRIRLNQDAETYVDLKLESPPLQAER